MGEKRLKLDNRYRYLKNWSLTNLRNWSCVVPLCMKPLAITVAVWQMLTLTASLQGEAIYFNNLSLICAISSKFWIRQNYQRDRIGF